MLLKILFVAVVLGAALVAVKQERLLEKSGLVGSCVVIRAPRGDDGQWHACKEGLMSGYPSLVKDSCTYQGRRAGLQYWRCPVGLEEGPIG